MRTYVYESALFVHSPIATVFDFFSDARNLERITPPSLRFEIVTPGPIRMAAGAVIDYRLRLHGIPFRWQSEIALWDPPNRFIDVQRRGPYRLWIHQHTFSASNHGTTIEDRVTYAVHGGRLAERLFVAPELDKIFDYRRRKLREIFPASEREDSASGENPDRCRV
jgi:ligand-binding SRPBCC domain-containing protein